MYAPIRLIIADDHEIFRNGFKLLLRDQADLELIGEAENGRQLMEQVEAHLPDLVITDIKMPVMDGIEATRLLREKYPFLGIIALSMFNEDELVVDMLEAGARGYLLKNTNKTELLTAARAVHEGNVYYCSATSARLAEMIRESRFNPYKHKPRVQFTPRELDVIRLVCQEYTNKEIAALLGLSARTVESYKENIQEKMGAKNSIGIAMYAVKNKLV
jgi:DNA-binding NarL/FixJ family response regulator